MYIISTHNPNNEAPPCIYTIHHSSSSPPPLDMRFPLVSQLQPTLASEFGILASIFTLGPKTLRLLLTYVSVGRG